MQSLRATIAKLTALHPAVITNDFTSLEALPDLLSSSSSARVAEKHREDAAGLSRREGDHHSRRSRPTHRQEARDTHESHPGDLAAQQELCAAALGDERLPMAELAELLVSQVMLLLSAGLHDGVDVWPVLDTLRWIPEKLSQASSTTTTTTAPGTASRDGGLSSSEGGERNGHVVTGVVSQRASAAAGPATAKGIVVSDGAVGSAATSRVRGVVQASSSSAAASQLEHGRRVGEDAGGGQSASLLAPAQSSARLLQKRLHFASQLVRTVRSGYPEAPTPVLARVFLRLALNCGCLCSALELIARHNRREIAHFYKSPELNLLFHYKQQPQSSPPRDGGGAARGGGGGDVPAGHGDLWEQFQAAMAPVGGVPLCDMEAGATKGFSLVHFNLSLFVPGLDDDLVDYTHPPTLAAYLLAWDTDQTDSHGDLPPTSAELVKGVLLPSSSAANPSQPQQAQRGHAERVVVGRVSPPSLAPRAPPALPSLAVPASAGSPFPPPSVPLPAAAYSGRSFSSLGFGYPSPAAHISTSAGAPPPAPAIQQGTSASTSGSIQGDGGGGGGAPPSLAPLGPAVKCFYHALGEYLYGLTRSAPPAVRCVRNHFLAEAWRRRRQTEAPPQVMIQVLPLSSNSNHRGAGRRAVSSLSRGSSSNSSGAHRRANPSRQKQHRQQKQQRHCSGDREGQRADTLTAEEAVAAFEQVKGQWASAVVERLRTGLGASVSPPSPPPVAAAAATEPVGASHMCLPSRGVDSGDKEAAATTSVDGVAGPSSVPTAVRGGRDHLPQDAQQQQQQLLPAPLLSQQAHQRKANHKADTATAAASSDTVAVVHGEPRKSTVPPLSSASPPPPPSAAAVAAPSQKDTVVRETKAPPLVRTLKAMRRASGLHQPLVEPPPPAPAATTTATVSSSPEESVAATEKGNGRDSRPGARVDGGEKPPSAAATVAVLAALPSSADPPGDRIDTLLEELEKLLRAYEGA